MYCEGPKYWLELDWIQKLKTESTKFKISRKISKMHNY